MHHPNSAACFRVKGSTVPGAEIKSATISSIYRALLQSGYSAMVKADRWWINYLMWLIGKHQNRWNEAGKSSCSLSNSDFGCFLLRSCLADTCWGRENKWISLFFLCFVVILQKKPLVSSTLLHFALIAPQTILSAFAKADSSCFWLL